MSVFFLLCASIALCTTTANPVPDVKQESPQELIPAQQNTTREMKRGQPLQKAGGPAVWKEGFTEPPYQYEKNCPPDFHEHWGRCFKFFLIPMAWIDAEKHCWLFDANLASIHDQYEYDFLINLINGPAWIGANDAVRFGDWLWSDGSVTDFEMPKDWNKSRRCLTISSYDYPTAKRHHCEERLPFICAVRPC